MSPERTRLEEEIAFLENEINCLRSILGTKEYELDDLQDELDRLPEEGHEEE